ncbi:MAG: TetR/AcrR family transcriptional regulator [Bacteroidales bacterium]|nr:TetR/AcrR family transcriptional regulator [Bacteroidales bacterium]
MYRIKNDKRTKRSVERITKSLTECLDKKPLAEIGVAEIAKGAGVSRATFYRIFDSPLDVLDYLCKTLTQELEVSMSQLMAEKDADYTLHAISFLINHAESHKAIFRSGRMDLLENSVRPRIELILPPSEKLLSETEMDYVKYSVAAILMAVLYVWYQHGCKESESELASVYNKISNVRYNYYSETPPKTVH